MMDGIISRRDGSLLKKKREQWEREKASPETWFPFGSPGGGAPNRKYHSGGDYRAEENKTTMGNEKEKKNRETLSNEFLQSTQTNSPSTNATNNMSCFSQPINLPNIPYLSQFSPAALPIRFVYSQNLYGQAIPSESQLNGAQLAYPVQLLPSTPVTTAATASPIMRSDSNSYTEQWTNQLQYWGAYGIGVDQHKVQISPTNHDNNDSTQNLSTISTNQQPLAVVQPLMIPVIPPSTHSTEYPYSPNQRNVVDISQNSLSVSLTSLNSSYRKNDEEDMKSRIRQAEQIFDAQVAEKRRFEAKQLDKEREENLRREIERKRIEDMEREKEMEEERKKRKADEEKKRTEDAVWESVLKAQQEAALRRKARLYKHLLEDSDYSAEHQLLGGNDLENSRILREVELLEMQKKCDEERIKENRLNKKPNNSSNANSSRRSNRLSECSSEFNNTSSSAQYSEKELSSINKSCSYEDNRPIHGLPLPSKTENDEKYFVRNVKERQSCRVPSSSRTTLKKRSDSLERAKKNSPSVSYISTHSTPQFTGGSLPVRLQRRIPPPSPVSSIQQRSRLANSRSISNGFNGNNFIDDKSFHKNNTEVSVNNSESKDKLSESLSRGKINCSNSNGEQALASISLSKAEESNLHRVNESNVFFTKQSTNHCLRNISNDNASNLTRQYPFENSSAKSRLKEAKNEESTLNPLFEPVPTRSKRNRMTMTNIDNAANLMDQSQFANNDIKFSFSTPSKFEKISVTKVNNEKNKEKPLCEENSTTLSVGNENVPLSPFKRTITAHLRNLHTRPEQDLISPVIKRKGETPSKLGSSSTNLSVENGEEGRMSPLTPVIERFHSKTSLYRSLNLKKLSAANEKTLENLTRLRLQLKEKQQQMERLHGLSNGSLASRSRTSSSINSISNRNDDA